VSVAEQLLIHVQSFFCEAQYPLHTLTADQEASGYEVWHVGNARRQANDAWKPTTANADHWIKVDCASARAASFLVIDRNSNHVGQRFILEHSSDGSSWTSVVDATIPAIGSGTPAATNGCTTAEGAWIKTFASVSKRYWRLTSKAMGAGVVPSLTCVWLGAAWEPTDNVLYYPVDDDGYDVKFEQADSPSGWTGRGRHALARSGSVTIKLNDTTHEATLRADILGLYGRGHPAWILWQKTDRPTAAVLGRLPAGRLALEFPGTWGLNRTLTLPFIEEQPVP
jgi:hypothetical protein